MKKLILAMGVILAFLLSTGIPSFAECKGDFDFDGDVDGSDLAVFAADFGRTDCPVAGPAPVEKTGQTKCYAVGYYIPCSGTGQDGDLRKGVVWPNPRFTDNNNGTVTDNLTGLVWLKNANYFGARNWGMALIDCNTLADDGVNLTDGSSTGDWRLPNVRELHSLVDFGNHHPALPAGHPFFGVQSSYYWSSTTYENYTSYAWDVYMSTGFVGSDDKTGNSYVWPVRSDN